MTQQIDVASTIRYGGLTISESDSIDAGGINVIDEAIPNSSADLLVNLTLDISKAVLLCFQSDQAIVIETNDGTTPADTITLAAGERWYWKSGEGTALTDILSADISGLYVTNASGAVANLKVIAAQDPTPAS